MTFWVRYESKQLSKCPGRPQINQGDTNGNPGVKQWTLNNNKKMNLLLFHSGCGLVGKLHEQKLVWPSPRQMVSRGCKGGRGPPWCTAAWQGSPHSPQTSWTKPWPLWEGTWWGPPAVGAALSSVFTFLTTCFPHVPPWSDTWSKRNCKPCLTSRSVRSFSLTSQDILVSPPKLGGTVCSTRALRMESPTWKVSLSHF